MARFRGVWRWLDSLAPIGRTYLESRPRSAKAREWHAVCCCLYKAAGVCLQCVNECG